MTAGVRFDPRSGSGPRIGNLPAATAVMGSHSASISRRTRDGGGFAPITAGEAVGPGEAIRLKATGIRNQSFNVPEFIITTQAGDEIFRRDAAAGALGGDQAHLDIAAPTAEGLYRLTVHAQSAPFWPRTHEVSMVFRVAADAAPPIDSPPSTGIGIGNIFGDVKSLGIIAIAVLGLVTIGPALGNISGRATKGGK